MKLEEFNQILEKQINTCHDILVTKGKEYGAEDRLHNFKVAAALQQISTQQALAGMMAKHTVSVYDMCLSGEIYSMELWNEKITDSINYLLLLKALVEENAKQLTCSAKTENITSQ